MEEIGVEPEPVFLVGDSSARATDRVLWGMPKQGAKSSGGGDPHGRHLGGAGKKPLRGGEEHVPEARGGRGGELESCVSLVLLSRPDPYYRDYSTLDGRDESRLGEGGG